MADYFKDWLFNQLPKYHQKTDTYVDGNGDGLLKRYLRVFGMELDENFIPYIDNFMDIIDYVKCDDKYLPLIGSILGYPPSIDGLSSTYRKILANIIAIYKIKGTYRSFEILFNLLGLEIYILEDMPKKAVTYDQDGAMYDANPLQEYDSTCDYCSGYWIVYNSKYDTCDPYVHNVVAAPLLDTVKNIICFLNPINAVFNGLLPRLKVCDDLAVIYNELINLCSIPLNLSVTYNTGTTTAVITWQGAGIFQMQYREYPNGVFSNPINANSGDAVNGLVNGTIYEFQVRKDCGAGSYSEWVSYLVYTGNGILNTGNSNISLKSIDYISNSPAVILLGDYFLDMDISNPIKIISILINGNWILGPGYFFYNLNDINTWLNGLGYGVFTLLGNSIFSLGNENTLSKLVVEINGLESDILFSQNNKRLQDNSIVHLLADYSTYVVYPLNIVSIAVNGIITAGPGAIANEADFLTWINGLGYGNFVGDGLGNVTITQNLNEFDKIIYNTVDDATERDLIFTQSNLKLDDTTNNILQTDYAISMDFTNAIKVISIKINGVDIPGDGNFHATNEELIIWLNSLGKGLWELSDGNIISNNNQNLVDSLVYETSADATNYTVKFSQRDHKITNLSGATGTIALNTTVDVNTYYITDLPAGVYDKITVNISPDNVIPIHGGTINTDNGTGPYNGFLDNGNLIFINVNLGALFQLNIF